MLPRQAITRSGSNSVVVAATAALTTVLSCLPRYRAHGTSLTRHCRSLCVASHNTCSSNDNSSGNCGCACAFAAAQCVAMRGVASKASGARTRRASTTPRKRRSRSAHEHINSDDSNDHNSSEQLTAPLCTSPTVEDSTTTTTAAANTHTPPASATADTNTTTTTATASPPLHSASYTTATELQDRDVRLAMRTVMSRYFAREAERVRPEELRRRYARELVLQRHAHTMRRIEEKSVRSMQLLGEDVCAVGDGIVPLYTPLSRRDCGGGGALSTLQRRSSESSSSSSSSSIGGVSAWRALNPVSCAADAAAAAAAAAACSDDADDDKVTATPWWSTALTSSASAARQQQRDGSSGEHNDAVYDGSVRIDDSEVAAEAAYSTHASQLAASGWRKTSLRGLCSPDLSIYDDDHDIRICSADVVALEQGRPLPSSLTSSQQLQHPHAITSLSTRLVAHTTNAGNNNNSGGGDHGTAAADDVAHIDDSRALAMATATAAPAAVAQLDTPRFDAGFDDDNSDDEADASDGGSSSATAAVCARAVRSMGASATAQLRQQLCEGSCDGDGEDDDLVVAAYTSGSHAHGMMMGSCSVDDDDDDGGRDDMFS